MELNILTLNCWGIPFISKDRKPRMKAIGEIIVQNKYDVVCLQEVWSEHDFDMISSIVNNWLPFGHYFHSGVIGSGICILSKYPIKETFFHQWPVNGYIHKIQHGDWFGGKGIGLCRIQVGEYLINVYSVHLHAEYSTTDDEYRVHRVLQAFDTAQFIRFTSGNANGIILAGDFNVEAGSLEYKLLLKSCGLQDSFMVKPKSGNTVLIGTNECARNSYADKKITKKFPDGKRIDYIFYKSAENIKCDMLNYCLPLPDRVPSQSFSYSDHEAVHVNLKFSVEQEEIRLLKNYQDELRGNNTKNENSKSSDELRNRITFVDKISTSNSERKCASVCHMDIHSSEMLLALKESVEISENYIKQLSARSTLFISFFIILFLAILSTSFVEIPHAYKIPMLILNIVLSFCSFFFILMATLWNSIERNATVAGIKSMRILMESIAQHHSKAFCDNV